MASFKFLQGSTITEIIDASTGLICDADKVVGDDDNALKLRTALVTNIENGTPLYLCPACFKALYLRSNPKKSGQYFAHRNVAGNCPKLEAQGLSEEQIRAIKYNGAKESPAHAETKQFLMECLEADPHFSGQAAEKVWLGETEKSKFRRPDVQAVYDNGVVRLRIAFEIQLSATFLSEIVQRREFYRKEGGLLVWVFRNFVEHDPKLTQLDIFYPNNLNSFVVSRGTRDASIKSRKFHLECHWAEPQSYVAGTTKTLKKKLVSFEDLVLNQETQQVYYFDYESAKNKLAQKLRDQHFESILARLKRYADMHCWNLSDVEFIKLKSEFEKYDIKLPTPPDKFHRLLKSLLSLEQGKVVGFNFKELVECGNLLFSQSPEHIFFFLVGSKSFDRVKALESQGNRDKWINKKKEVWDDLKRNGRSSKFWWDEKLVELVLLLFPTIRIEFNELRSELETYWSRH